MAFNVPVRAGSAHWSTASSYVLRKCVTCPPREWCGSWRRGRGREWPPVRGGELFCDGNRRVVALCNRNCFPFGGLFAWPSATEERTKARQRPAVIRQKRETRLDGKINKSRSADRRGTQELRMLAQRTASKDEAHAWVSRRQLRHKDGWTGCEWGENQRTAVAVPER